MRLFHLALLALCIPRLVRSAHGAQSDPRWIPGADFEFARKHRHYRRNVVNFVVASEGLALSTRVPAAIHGGWKGIPRHDLATKVLLGVNAAILSAWCVSLYLEYDICVEWMKHNFLLSQDKNQTRARPHTIITSVFSHCDVNHFLSNMGALQVFVPDVIGVLGLRGFAYFYVASAYASRFLDNVMFSRSGTCSRYMSRAVVLAKMYVERIYLEKGGDFGGNNTELIEELIDEVASGVLSAVISFHCLSFPHKMFTVGGRSLAAPLAAVVWAANDLLRLHDDPTVGHGSHLGGALFGFVVYAIRMFVGAQSRMKLSLWLRDFASSPRKRERVMRMLKDGALKVARSIDGKTYSGSSRIGSYCMFRFAFLSYS